MTTAYSHSTRQLYLSCPRKFYLRKTLHLEADRDPSGLRMGKVFADALEIAAEYTDPVKAKGMALGLVSQQMAKATDKARQSGQATLIDRLKLEQVQLEVLVAAYLDRYHGSMKAEALSLGAVQVVTEREVAFEDPILGPGRLDAIVEWGNRRIGIEDKLLAPGFWREANERQLRINAQVTAYFAAMRAAGTPIDELRYRVTFKPTIKPNSRTGETLEEYRKRLTDRVRNEKDYAFREYRLHRSERELDAFVARCQSVARAMARAKRDLPKYGEAAYPANYGTACTEYGECEYLELCISGGTASGYRVATPRHKLTANQERALGILNRSLTGLAYVSHIQQMTGWDDNTARSALERLTKLGLTDKEKSGRYVMFSISEAGEKWLA